MSDLELDRGQGELIAWMFAENVTAQISTDGGEYSVHPSTAEALAKKGWGAIVPAEEVRFDGRRGFRAVNKDPEEMDYWLET